MKSLSPQLQAFPSQNTLTSHPNYYNSQNFNGTPIKGPPAYIANNFPITPPEIRNKSPFTPTESHFFPQTLVRTISPSIIAKTENRNSRSISPYIMRYQNGTPVDSIKIRAHPNVFGQNNGKQRVFNVTNVERENRHKIETNSELDKVKERNTSLSKKLQILEDIVGNCGLELMEQKINKLLGENDRLTSILQENREVSNKTLTSNDEKIPKDLSKEIERLNKTIQNQANDIELWKKRWNEAERTSLNISKTMSTVKEKEKIKEKNEEIEKLNFKLKNQIEDSNIQELENSKKITILLQENDKLNSILNNQIDELDKLAIRYQELESKHFTNALNETQFEAIQRELEQTNQKMNHLLQENEFLMEKIKEQDKDLTSIKLLEHKIEMVVEENVKNNNLLKLKVEECDFFRKKCEEEQFNIDFFENENHNQKLIIEELKAKINILIDENKKLNESFTMKIVENVALTALEEKIEILMEENVKLNELNRRNMRNGTEINNNDQADVALIYEEKAVFLEKKNMILLEEMEKMKMEFEKSVIENQQIGEIELKTELLIEENMNLNNIMTQKDEEIFYWKKKFLNSSNEGFENGQFQSK